MKTLRCAFAIALIIILWASSTVHATPPAQPWLVVTNGQVTLGGQPGRGYQIETATALSPGAWKTWTNLTLSANVQALPTPQEGINSAFFRVLLQDSDPLSEIATTFRSIDHTGLTRDWTYYQDGTDMVLAFFDPACPDATNTLIQLQNIQNQYALDKVRCWAVAVAQGDVRARLNELSTHANTTLPVVQDSSGTVAQSFGARYSGETIAFHIQDWLVFYQGPFNSWVPPGSDQATRPLLQQALTDDLAGTGAAYRYDSFGDACPLPQITAAIPDYAGDVAPILIQSCVRCHSPGNIGTYSMDNYTTVKQYSESIRDRVVSKAMPPWHADPHFGKFSNDSSLKPEEIRTIVKWVDAGAPRGTGPDPLLTYVPPANDWPIGQPDLILSIPTQSLPASGLVDYRYINVPTGLTTDKWVRAAVVLPGNRTVVHHGLVFSEQTLGGLLGYFAGYVPGQDPAYYPEGTAKLLKANAVLQFQMHYITTGTPQTDVTRLGLYFATNTTGLKEVKTKAANSISFVIPANKADYRAESGFYTFTKRSTLFGMAPHMHLRGSAFRYELTYPDTTKETILSVPFYEFHWQTLYTLATPKSIPVGTKLKCFATFDNSALNDENPDPSAIVKFGEQTQDEMLIGYFNYIEE